MKTNARQLRRGRKRGAQPRLCVLLSATALVVSLGAVAAPTDSANPLRYKALAKIINRNVGHAHMTRGVNVCTILALRTAVTEHDIGILGELLESGDPVHRLAAGYVLSVMGAPGIDMLKARGARLGAGEASGMAARADETRQSLASHRANDACSARRHPGG